MPAVVVPVGGALTAVPGVLRVDQPVQLTAVEEDPAALRALVDVDAVALVGAHGPVALRTGQLHAAETSPDGRWFPAPSVQGTPHIGLTRADSDTGHPAAEPQGAPAHGQGRRLRPGGCRRHPGRRHARRGRLRVVRRADRADPRPAGAGRQRADHDLQQLRCRRRCARHPALRRADHQDHQLLRRRQQGARAAVPVRPAGGGADPAGHPRREAARRRGGHPRLLHPDRCGHDGRRGRHPGALRRRGQRGEDQRAQGGPRLRRPPVRAGDRADRRLRPGPRRDRRPARQPGVPRVRRELQRARGHGRADHHRRGRGAGRARRDQARARPPARGVRRPRGRRRQRGQADRDGARPVPAASRTQRRPPPARKRRRHPPDGTHP